MGERNVGGALTIGHGNEDIRFVEDDESSSERQLPPPPKIPVPAIAVRPQTPTVEERVQNADERAGSYAEIATSRILSPPTSRYISKSKEKIHKEPTQKSRRKSDIVHSFFSRTSSLRKSRQEYEKVLTREDSTYSNVVESPSLSKTPGDNAYRLRSYGGYDIKRSEVKIEDDEQMLEVLRQVVRKCTNPDPMKRLSSADVLELVDDPAETS